jgi:hypothetical protein
MREIRWWGFLVGMGGIEGGGNGENGKILTLGRGLGWERKGEKS